MKKDILYVLIQFVLFALYFVDWSLLSLVFPDWMRFTSIGLLVFGLFVILLGILHLNDNLTVFPSPKKGAHLISNGIYAYVRHPIYTGIIISMTSYSIFSVSPVKFIITGVMIVVLYLKSKFEERKLMESFATYEKYRESTGRFLPKLTNLGLPKWSGKL